MARMAQAGAAAPAGGSQFLRAFLVGGTAVAAGLGGFYANMLRMKKKEQAAGNNPRFEQIVAHVSQKPLPEEELQFINSPASNTPPAIPGTQHYSGHSTIRNYRTIQGYAEGGEANRYMAPPAQRPHSDQPHKAYTKSPDYVKNYEKTRRPSAKADVEPTAVAVVA